MIRGQGMPAPRHHTFGNMHIQFNVKFPEKNWTQDPEAFEALRKFLPAPAQQNVPPESMTEPADLEEVDNANRGFGDSAMEEDEEHEHPHAERVQCASQ